MKDFFTRAEAAAFLSRGSQFPLSERDVLDLTEQEKLPICFKFDGELSGMTIRHPNNAMEEVDRRQVSLFHGVLRSLGPPTNHEALAASLVQIVRVDGMRFEHRASEQGPILVKGFQLPTEAPHSGRIRSGFEVTAWVNFADIPAEDWLFHADDLAALVAPSKTTPLRPMRQQPYQEQQILEVIRSLGHDPKALPPNVNGKRGIRAKVRAELTMMSRSVFDKAWERLSGDRRIQYAAPSPD